MKKFVLLMLVSTILVISPAAFAQSSAEQADCPPNQKCVEHIETAEPVEYVQKTATSTRYAAEVSGALVAAAGGAIAGGVVGMVSGSIFTATRDGSDEGLLIAISTVLGAAAGAAAALPLGVYAGGQLTDGNGSLLATYIGGMTGIATGYALLYTSEMYENETLQTFSVVLGLVAPLVGSMVGYELSSDPTTVPIDNTGLSAARPLISVSPDGESGYVGMGWSF